MNVFLQKYPSDVIGVLSGFDRVVIRGHIRQLSYVDRGLNCYLILNGLGFKDYHQHALELTARLREAVEAPVREAKRLVKYLDSPNIDKEALVQAEVAEHRIRNGPICLLSCVESCKTFEVHRNKETRSLELRPRLRRCTFLYKYSFHPTLGYIQARIQTWFPFNVQIYFNGREWLSRQMDAVGLKYRRYDNTFVWLQDVARAQKLMNEQLHTDWPRLFEEILRDLNPLHPAMFGKFRASYYWSSYQTEWATDVMFKTPQALERLYRPMVRYAINCLSCTDVLRYLGKSPSNFMGEVQSNLVERAEGVRIKHGADGNGLKAYDKAYAARPGDWSVLRLESTMTNPRSFKTYRASERNPDGPKSWRPLRKGVADLYRLTEVSQKATERYADALVACDGSEPLEQLMSRLVSPATTSNGRRVRGLRPWAADDLALLRAVSRGEFSFAGLRNRDLCRQLYDEPTKDPKEKRRRSARVGRLLRLLRAHHILKKVPRTHRYQVTEAGRKALAIILAAAEATAAQLTRLAA